MDFSVRLIKNDDLVYWAEYSLDVDRQYKYLVCSGYYLASYWLLGKLYHVVSAGNVSSCVVRHIKDGEIFSTEKEAQLAADVLNNKEGI